MLAWRAVKDRYTEEELAGVLARAPRRSGWDFSGMRDLREPVPWDYPEVVARYLRAGDEVLDVGTGGGEQFGELAACFGRGLGIDVDPAMVDQARRASAVPHVEFRVGSHRLEEVTGTFDVVLNRQAPFDLAAVAAHLKPGGYFITQQVGERNMRCVKEALGQSPGGPVIAAGQVADAGLRLVAFGEYDVQYVVADIDSLVFWLGGLDAAHADLDGSSALASAAALNRILAGNVDERGFVTNEHRYLAIASAASWPD
jgi:SAM-dependent methyltransferase